MKPDERWACIARQGGFGDNLIASTVLPGLKKRYDKVEVIAGKPMHVMFENNPYVDKLTVLEPGVPAWGNGHDWQKWYYERSKEYAFFANLSHSCEISGVLLKVQTPYWWSDKYRRQLCSKSYLEIAHDICDIPYDEIAPNFFPTDEEKERAEATKKKVGAKYIGWVLTGSRIDKIYPYVDVVIAQILKELKIPVVMFGAPGKDYEFAKLIQEYVKKCNRTDEGLHLALSPEPDKPSWPPRRVCAQVQLSDVVIGPDTGPMWAVAMHDMPKILLASHAGEHNITAHWRNTITLHADRIRVPCFACHRLHDDPTLCTPNQDKNGAACISDIGVDDIMHVVKAALSQQPIFSGALGCGVVADSYNDFLKE